MDMKRPAKSWDRRPRNRRCQSRTEISGRRGNIALGSRAEPRESSAKICSLRTEETAVGREMRIPGFVDRVRMSAA